MINLATLRDFRLVMTHRSHEHPHLDHSSFFEWTIKFAFVVSILGLIFQIGHFAEHAFQFAIWLLGDLTDICGRDTAWMSSWATYFVQKIGEIWFPDADAKRQMMMGMEWLHLVGNAIFLSGLIAVHHCVQSKWSRWGVYIESFHLYEHLMLTTSAYFIGKPIGLSTLFGGTNLIFSKDLAVGFRVTWHFLMNLLPLPFAMMAIYEKWQLRHEPSTVQMKRGNFEPTPLRS